MSYLEDPVNGVPLKVLILDLSLPYAIPYERYSSGKQGRGSSLYRQRGQGGSVEDSNEYIASVILELPLNETLTDAGLSAYSGEHLLKGAFGSLMAKVRNGEIPPGCILILDEWSRLARLPQSESQKLLTDLIHADIGIYIKKTRMLLNREKIDGPNGSAELLGAVFALRAAWEDSQSRGRGVQVARHRRLGEARRDGRKMSSLGPSWLETTGNRESLRRDFVPHPDRLWVTQRIMRELVYTSFDGVARGLNRDWLQTEDADLSRRCTPWGIALGRAPGSLGWIAATISELAYNRALIGEYQPTSLQPVDPKKPMGKKERRPDGDLMPDYYTWEEDGVRRAAITMVEWEAAHAAIASRRNAAHDRDGRRVGKGGRKGEHMPNLFTGMAHCGACGSAMIFRRSKASPSRPREYSYFQCRSARMGKGCTHRTHYAYLEIEQRVGRIMAQDWLFRRGTLAGGDTPTPAAEQIAADDRRLQIIQGAVDAWYQLPAGPLKDMALVNANASMAEKFEIEARRPGLIRQRDEETGARTGAHGQAVKRLWAMATAVAEGAERSAARKQLHAALALLIDGLYFGDGDVMLTFGGRAFVAYLDETLDRLLVRGKGDTFHRNEQGRLSAALPITPEIAALFETTAADIARRQRLIENRGPLPLSF